MKLLQVKTSSPRVSGETCLFEPVAQPWWYRGLSVPDMVDDTGETTLVVANTHVEPVLLGEGDVIGHLQLCEVVQPDSHKDIPGVCVSAVQAQVLEQGHVKKF